MINRYIQVDAPGTDAMHAEPIAALAALKLASLDLPSTQMRARGPNTDQGSRCAILQRAVAECAACRRRQD
jgi:hypothetical protein